ncbi:MAG TPA: hypothetical protein VF283_10190 [Bryobacteraceae bacterium]
MRPLFEARESPEIQALDKEIAALAVEQRQLAFAFRPNAEAEHRRDHGQNHAVLLEPWKQQRSRDQDSRHPIRKRTKAPEAKR